MQIRIIQMEIDTIQMQIRTTQMKPWHDSEHPEDQVYASGKWDIGQGLAANCHRRRDRKCNGIFLLGLTDSRE